MVHGYAGIRILTMCGALIVAPCPITLSSSLMGQGSRTGSKKTQLRRILICTALVKHVVGSIYIHHGLKNRKYIKQKGEFTLVVLQGCLLLTWDADFCSSIGVEDSGLVHVVYELRIGFSCTAPSHCCMKRVLKSMILKKPSWS